MKTIFLLVLIFCGQISYSQEMPDFFSNKTQVVLLGLDFTLAKFIGPEGFPKENGLKNHSMKQWNKFFALEPGKYSLQDAFDLSDKYYYNSINYFLKRNESLVDISTAIIDVPYTITEEQVRENVKTYSTFEKEGLAVSFVVESFNKKTEEGTVWVAFLSLPDNEIIYMEKMVGKPGGAGQANYWARSIYEIVSQIEKRAKEFENK